MHARNICKKTKLKIITLKPNCGSDSQEKEENGSGPEYFSIEINMGDATKGHYQGSKKADIGHLGFRLRNLRI